MGNRLTIRRISSGGTSLMGGSSPSGSSATSWSKSNSSWRFVSLRNLSDSLTTILDAHALSEPAPR